MQVIDSRLAALVLAAIEAVLNLLDLEFLFIVENRI
jgi:hypothetical protein